MKLHYLYLCLYNTRCEKKSRLIIDILHWFQHVFFYQASLGCWNDSFLVTSTLCLTFGLLLTQFVWNGYLLLWSFLHWEEIDEPVLYSQLIQLWFYIIYTEARWVKVSVLDQFWPTEKVFYCTCFFPFNEIFQWHFDYLPPWREKEQFEDRLTFPLLSTTTCSAFPIYHILSIHSATHVHCKYTKILREFDHKPTQPVCVSMWCFRCIPGWDLQRIPLSGR